MRGVKPRLSQDRGGGRGALFYFISIWDARTLRTVSDHGNWRRNLGIGEKSRVLDILRHLHSIYFYSFYYISVLTIGFLRYAPLFQVSIISSESEVAFFELRLCLGNRFRILRIKDCLTFVFNQTDSFTT